MGKMPWVKFFPDRWLYDTRILDDSEKATWIDLLCFMWNAPCRGKLVGSAADLARMVGKQEREFLAILDGLRRKNVAEALGSNDDLTIISRRMTRDEKARVLGNSRQRRWYEKNKSNGHLTDKKIEDKKKIVGAVAPPPPAELFEHETGKKAKGFTKPTPEEVTAYGLEIGYQIDGQKFFDHYAARGWQYKAGSPMKDWRAAVRTWKRRDEENGGQQQGGTDWRITQSPVKN